MIRRRHRSTRRLLPVAAITADGVRLKGGGLRAVLECATLEFGIKGAFEQRMDGLRGGPACPIFSRPAAVTPLSSFTNFRILHLARGE